MVKAIIYREYGPPHDVLELAEIETPAVGDGDVSVRVQAASVNPGDWDLLNDSHTSSARPSDSVHRETASWVSPSLGGVEAVGKGGTEFQPGNDVYAGISRGGFAEYVVVPETTTAPMPANLTYEQAAAVPVAAVTALQGLRDVGRVQPGQKVLINGASGGVGTFAVQIAKYFGAEVTGVCRAK